MKLETIKDLEKVIRLCRKLGVDAIKVDGVEFALGREPVKAKASASYKTQNLGLMPNGITEDTKIEVEGYTEEQILMWSAQQGEVPENQQ